MSTIEITMKYNLGNEVYFMHQNRIWRSKIISYEVINTGELSYDKSQYPDEPDELNQTITYMTYCNIKVDEKDVFSNEDDIISFLRAKIQKSIYPVK